MRQFTSREAVQFWEYRRTHPHWSVVHTYQLAQIAYLVYHTGGGKSLLSIEDFILKWDEDGKPEQTEEEQLNIAIAYVGLFNGVKENG